MDVGISRTQARDTLDAMLAAAPTPEADATIRAAMLAANEREISAEELAGYADALRAAAVPIPSIDGLSRHLGFPRKAEGFFDHLTDTCGTGGDQRNTFNISTAAGLLAAACGVPVAKHGNRSATSKCGSADVLEALGIPMQGPGTAAAALRDHNFAFLFAPAFHPGMARVAPIRKSIGVRTFFNLLGPLANPAGARRQLIGTFSNEKAWLMAQTLNLLGAEHAMVVHASDGLDEITLTAPTYVAETRNGIVREFELAPADFGLATHAGLEPYAGAETAAGNAEILLRLFNATAEADPNHREIVLANAAAVLVVSGICADWPGGMELARATLDSGKAAQHLRSLQTQPRI